MSNYTKFRSYRLDTSRFAALDAVLRSSWRTSKAVLDTRYHSVEPGKPIKGGIDFTRMNAAYRPRFYWVGDRLTVAIPDALSTGTEPAYAQESSFWAELERAIVRIGGTPAGQGMPQDLPADALR